MNNRPSTCAVLVTLLLVTAPLSAHHGAAAYDIGHPTELAATVMQYEVTVDDPKAYASPWIGRMTFSLRPDWETFEHGCTTRGDEYLEYKRRAWERPAQP